jgi:hypothetical protein
VPGTFDEDSDDALYEPLPRTNTGESDEGLTVDQGSKIGGGSTAAYQTEGE